MSAFAPQVWNICYSVEIMFRKLADSRWFRTSLRGWLIVYIAMIGMQFSPSKCPAEERTPTIEIQGLSSSIPCFVSARPRLIPELCSAPEKQLLRFPLQSSTDLTASPTRLIRLINGDQLTAVIVAGDRQSLRVCLGANQRIRIPWDIVSSISALPGERILFHDPFASGRSEKLIVSPSDAVCLPQGVIKVLAGQPVLLSWDETLHPSRICFRFCWQGPENHRPAGSGWSWVFSSGARLSLQQVTQHETMQGNWLVTSTGFESWPTTIKSIPLTPGWHVTQMQIIGERLFVTLDDQLLSAGSAPNSLVQGLEFHVDQTATGSWWIDQITATTRDETITVVPRASATDADQLITWDGDAWWGDFQSMDPNTVTWSDGHAQWQRDVQEIQQLIPRISPTDPVARRLRGKVVRFTLQPTADRPDLPGDHFIGVLGPSEHSCVTVEHPLLGKLMIPRTAIREIQSRFLGEWIMLSARELRPNVTPVSETKSPADAHRLGMGRVVLQEIPLGNIYFSVDAADLEPAGAQTPPGSPTLKSLRTGHGVTELFLNEQRVGTLNELTSQWSLPGQYDRLRLRIPTHVLRTGENTWKLTVSHGGKYQDLCQRVRLRNVSLELEFPNQ